MILHLVFAAFYLEYFYSCPPIRTLSAWPPASFFYTNLSHKCFDICRVPALTIPFFLVYLYMRQCCLSAARPMQSDLHRIFMETRLGKDKAW
jgi:hypothetical protein